jgi:hypothetical protein
MARNDEICYMELGNVKNNHLNQPIPDFLENKIVEIVPIENCSTRNFDDKFLKITFPQSLFFRLKIKEFF